MSASSSDSLGDSSDDDDNGDRSRDLLSSFYGTLAPTAEEVEDEEPAAAWRPSTRVEASHSLDVRRNEPL